MTRDKQLEIAVAALRDILLPWSYFKRRADAAGFELNAHVHTLINDPETARGLAREALRKMGRRV